MDGGPPRMWYRSGDGGVSGQVSGQDPLSWAPCPLSLTHSDSLPGQANTPLRAPQNTVTTRAPSPDEASISSLPPPHLELHQRFKIWSRCLSPNSRCGAVTVAMGQREER